MDRPARLALQRALLVVVAPFQRFFRTSSASGVVLLASTIAAMAWANSRYGGSYHHVFGERLDVQVGEVRLNWPIHAWINDGLMAIFFFLVGMEIKRELVVGELRTLRRALLPAVAALGGMVVPALLYHALNRSGPGRSGWGVPMATDIAFALGCLAVVRARVAPSLAVFLTALAIFDDLGAIVVIALFYGQAVHVGFLGAAGGLTLLLIAMNLLGARSPWAYALVGVGLWYAVLRSGVHATVAGVIVGLCIPARAAKDPRAILDDLRREVDALEHALAAEDDDDRGNATLRALEAHLEDVQPPLNRLTAGLHAPVAFAIVPLFALANAGLSFASVGAREATSPVSLGVALGLFVGKQLGVFSFTWLCVRLGLSPRPEGATWRQLYGVSILAGIGFTMSLFISGLAFASAPALQESARLGVLLASTASAVVGVAFLLARPARA